jgi:superfamily II DNA helicase RecQ
VQRLKRKYPLPGQIIVYCGTTKRTVQMAEALGAVCYYRAVGSAEDKRKIVQQLTSGQEQVFTATNALGLGIDAPTIRAVVHMGTIWKMRHYAQESGRAGRDGKVSEAIIMRPCRETQRGRAYIPFGKDVEEEVQELIGGRGCMRRVIDEAMDGAEQRWGCEEDKAPCQRCGGLGESGELGGARQAGREEAARDDVDARQRTEAEFEQQRIARRRLAMQAIERQGKEAAEVEALAELIEEWRVGC